ncbi:MAG: V-type ATP synthase subunit I [Candidatus Margulisiibacteriota bacterium]
MSIVEMQKIHIVSVREHKDQILKCLQKNEVLDIQSVSEAESLPISAEELSKYEYHLAEIKSAITFLESAGQIKRSFIETFIPPKEEISEEELVQTCREFKCPEIVKKCSELENRLANLKNLKIKLQTEHDKLLPWRKFEVPLNTLTCTVKTCVVLGSIKTKLFREFKNKIERATEAVEIKLVNKTKEGTYLAMVYLAAQAQFFADLLSKTDFNQITLPITENIPKQEITRIGVLLSEIEIETKEILAEARGLGRHLIRLKYMYDYTLENKAGLEIKQKLADTDYTFIIEGWIKKADFNKLKQQLSKVTNESEIFKIEAAPGEKPPIVLKNPAILSPFELITKIYGTPRSEEFDPSIPLSFFFALFFGICLGDFGYGLILAAVSIFFLKKYRLPEGGKKLFQLFLLGGGVSALVGILTGSYLGLSPEQIPAVLLPLKNFLSSIQIVDPVKSPLTMLVLSLTLGVVQILFGIFIQMLQRIKNKQIVSAILDDGLWIFFLGSLVFLIVSNALSLQTVQIASRMSLAGTVALVLTQGRHKKNILQKFFSGLLSLYKVSGYMGDTLSYSRLLALGMSTTIIGSVINLLAGMVKGVPVLGLLLMMALLIFGHLFNLLVGTLGAFVHSTRLQMVEFFSKFYEGGGREFRPYKREAEYTILRR